MPRQEDDHAGTAAADENAIGGLRKEEAKVVVQ